MRSSGGGFGSDLAFPSSPHSSTSKSVGLDIEIISTKLLCERNIRRNQWGPPYHSMPNLSPLLDNRAERNYEPFGGGAGSRG